MIPQVGQLSAPFVVQTRSVTRDSFEQPIETWTDAGYVWAKVETRGGFGKGEFEDTRRKSTTSPRYPTRVSIITESS